MSWPLIARAYGWLGPLQALASLVVFFGFLQAMGWHYGQSLALGDPLYVQGTTACLATIVMCQVVNLLVCRHPRLAAWRLAIVNNRLLVVGWGVEIALLLAIVMTPPGQWLFATAVFPAWVWLAIGVLALGFGTLEELRKWLVRKYGRSVEPG